MADSFEKEMQQLTDMLTALGDGIPQKGLASAAKAGAVIVRRNIVSKAPIRSGALQGGIILRKERSRIKDKAVYDVAMDPAKNSIFQKSVQNPDRLNGSHAYYPASMEYGFLKRRTGGGLSVSKSDTGSDRVDGHYFMRDGAVVAEASAEKAIVEALEKEVDKLWK